LQFHLTQNTQSQSFYKPHKAQRFAPQTFKSVFKQK